MKYSTLTLLVLTCSVAQTAAATDAFHAALSGGKPTLDMRLRYESVDQDNTLEDASALTLRTKIGYETGSLNGFNALVEIEDSSIILDQGDFTSAPTGFNPGQFSVVADPETTEIDQSFLQYKNEAAQVKLGRQVVALGNHRFVGDVGWRQDRQTFDGLTIKYKPTDTIGLFLGQLNQRNGIYAEALDTQSTDTLINVSYNTSFGQLVGYSYLLEVDSAIDNSLDTYGFNFNGKVDNFLYVLEAAEQDVDVAGTEYSASYFLLNGGLVMDGGIIAKLAYESLGSDNGAYGFSTPLATLHKFNGWSDQFLMTPTAGLVDISLSVSAKALGGKVAGIYHDFTADEDVAGSDDFGSEVNLLYVRTVGKHYNVGVKLASYSAGDLGGKVDTDKIWFWVSTRI